MMHRMVRQRRLVLMLILHQKPTSALSEGKEEQKCSTWFLHESKYSKQM